jgi:hypothetical protein
MFERFCVILKALEIACQQLILMPGAASPIITEPFVSSIRAVTNNPESNFFLLDSETIKRAKVMLDFCNMNKLLLAKYPIDTNLSYDANLDKILTNYQVKSSSKGSFAGITEEQLRNMKRVMMFKGNRVIPSKISHGNFDVKLVENVMSLLEERELGRLVVEIPNNHIPCKVFYKASITDIQEKPQIGKAIQDMGLTIQSVIDIIQLHGDTGTDLTILNETK